MKKTFRSVLSLLMTIIIIASVFTFSVSAASVSISGTGEIEVGKTFNVTIRFSADATLYAVEADVNYNSSVLRLNSVSGADYNASNGNIKIVDDGFSATKPSKTSSYTLNFTAIAAGNSNISVSVLGGGEATSKASASAAVTVVTPKPSSNANLASINLSSGSLSPAFNPNVTEYSAVVKYNVDTITITASVADGGATYAGGGTFSLREGDNKGSLTVTAADGTKKSYTITIKRLSEKETAEAEQAARDANPLLVIINGEDYTIVNDLKDVAIPTGFSEEKVARKESEITVLKEAGGKYQLCWLTDKDGIGAFFSRDENDNYTKLNYIMVNDTMYIIEEIDTSILLPQGYKNTKYEIDGIKVDAISYYEEKLSDFYIFNCYIPGNSGNALYKYDAIEGTMQRAVDFMVAVSADQSDATVDAPQQNTGNFAWLSNMTKTGKLVFFIIVFAAVILIAFAIVLIVKIATPGHDDYDEYDTEGNNDFVLSDFSTDEPTEDTEQNTDDNNE